MRAAVGVGIVTILSYSGNAEQLESGAERDGVQLRFKV